MMMMIDGCGWLQLIAISQLCTHEDPLLCSGIHRRGGRSRSSSTASTSCPPLESSQLDSNQSCEIPLLNNFSFIKSPHSCAHHQLKWDQHLFVSSSSSSSSSSYSSSWPSPGCLLCTCLSPGWTPLPRHRGPHLLLLVYRYSMIDAMCRMALILKMMIKKLRTAGYMLLYLACLRALTICLATVSSSRLIKGAQYQGSTFNIDLQDQPFLTLDHHYPPGTEQRLDSVLWSFAPQSCRATSSIRLLLGSSWNNMAYSARTWKVFHWGAFL